MSLFKYGAGVRGFAKVPYIEQVRTEFCKQALGVKCHVSSIAVYAEVGSDPGTLCITLDTSNIG